MNFFSWLRYWTPNRARGPQSRTAVHRCQLRLERFEDRMCPSGVSFGPAINFAAGDTPASVAVGDFNGDDRPDLAVANFDSDNVSVLLGDGNGGFAAAVNFAAGDYPESLVVGDFNGDNRLDLAVANSFSDTVSVLLGDGDGGFAAPRNFRVGMRPRFMAVGDFNGDDLPDLAVPNFESGNVSVLLNNAAGGFIAAVNFAVEGQPRSVAVGDFNGDDRLDLAVTGIVGFNDSNNVSVLLGNGAGGFAAAVNFATGFGPFSVAVGDFNGDDRPDLAVANVHSDNVSVLLGNGAGGFAAAVNFATGDEPESVAVGDFNGDGRPDLAVANLASDNVSVLLNNQPPTVSDFTKEGAEDNLLTFAAADFTSQFHDEDGDALAAVQIVTLPPDASGTLTLHGVAVSAGQVIATTDLDSLVFVPAHNFSGTVSFQYTASDGFQFANTPATVTLQIVSAAQQAANLQAQIDSLLRMGVLNQGQANALSVKLNLKDNAGDIGRIQGFLNQVAAYQNGGLLTPLQADELMAAATILLVSLH